MPGSSPLIVGLGGTTRSGSSSEKMLRYALRAAEGHGARVRIFDGPSLNLPLYAPEDSFRSDGAVKLVEALRESDGVIIASPGYHGSVSGLIKNALDYVEDMAKDEKVYLDGKSAGLIACAYGYQATGSTLTALRSIAHALRAWPTPLGVAVNTIGCCFDENGKPLDDAVREQLDLLSQQVVQFARWRAAGLEACKVA
ncbi:FMN reductase [Croceicoccus estronivorus]|uniref:NADPH-dependent FMN reductase n=1 Tax=Croceicoccus estronivorus TaxID=1172626 RepID=UPI0008326AF7|nr:NADPH-dependent FMN reductase [Croceicoccus estronivorus]OCC23741.1 FMN reductase [Croceicoccus estronivorus]